MDNNITTKPTPKALAKELYIKGFSLERIADILNKQLKTIKNYKAIDGDWDSLKASRLIESSNEEGKNIYSNFIEQMYLAIAEIRADESLNASEKSVALSRVGDSFTKMQKVAREQDPRAYKLNVAKKVIELVVNEFKDAGEKECVRKLVNMLDTPRFIKAIEELE